MDRTSGTTRRAVLGGMVGAAGLAGIGGTVPVGKARAQSAPRPGSLADVRHVVILMQENRSFDHYFGTMAGVRGFGDPTALRSPAGGADAGGVGARVGREVGSTLPRTAPKHPGTVLAQPDSGSGSGYRLPFRIDTRLVDGQDITDLPHDWASTHRAWAGGAYDGWVAAKSAMTMGYFTEADIPFHRALAGAFTLCDHYFCSIQGPTTPNRLYHWTGTIDPEGRKGGSATDNPPDYRPVFDWTTYPERLEKAGVSWQVYADDVAGDTDMMFLGDFGDNPLWLFRAYHAAANSSDPAVRRLAERANVTGSWPLATDENGKSVDYVLRQFISACRTQTLPQVSWIVAPQGYSEHPAARPVDGEAYVERVLQALWEDPELWRSTVLLINFDENDGLFDHLVPPTAPPGTPGEQLPLAQTGTGVAIAADAHGPLTPIGLGPRVPMLVISPWSRGGWIDSQVFDHTSVLRFLEQWTGVREPNISPWRRAVCGDLLSCFDFRSPDFSIPSLPDAKALRAQADRTQSKLPMPSPPMKQSVPHQDPGSAKARPLPYQPIVWAEVSGKSVTVHLANHGREAIAFQAYAFRPEGGAQVSQIVVGAGAATSREIGWSGNYDLEAYAANGFRFCAAGGAEEVVVSAALRGTAEEPALVVSVRNTASTPLAFLIGETDRITVPPDATHEIPVPASDGWYDLTLTGTDPATWSRRFTGHLENGRPSRTW
ncbi:phosphocholine-specific phospholipase C [Nocardia macrotermitis]|uniref:phospholipase C n=1 Tax=Nocardia macrotermitis TaxID=2585198 RepID=A0A7K0D549_9NOCA|nr:phospholipase C, phosphocholine-specific [Nocardia macrotermitis]MQY20681.1 Non-hemolytic phospholipase C [Nocardia macrotermitis]